MYQESQQAIDAGERLDSQKRDYEQRLVDRDSQIAELQNNLDRLSVSNDEKDLEVSRLRRDCDDNIKKNKSLNEKI